MANHISYFCVNFQRSFELRTRHWRIKWGKRLRTEPSVTLKSRLSLTSQETTTKARSWSFLTGSNETWSKERLIQVTTFWLQKSDTQLLHRFLNLNSVKLSKNKRPSDRHCQVERSNKFHRSSLPKGASQLKCGHRVVIMRFFCF